VHLLEKNQYRELQEKLTPKITKYIPHIPTPKQQAFLLLECKDAFYGGAAGGGKSDALLMAALQYVDVPGYAALLIRDTYQNLVMPGALLERSDTWLAGTDAKWDSQAKTWLFPTIIKLKNGKTIPGKPASITFGYLDKDKDHLRYKSAEFQFIGLDEATDLRWNQIIYLFSRLRRLKGHMVPLRFRLASNPGGISHNEIKNKYVDPKTRKKGVAFIPAGLSDNPYLEADEYRDSLSNLDPTTREQLMNGDWNVKKSSNTFLREWWVLCDERWHKNEIMTAVRYWDLASTDEKSKVTKEPCYTAGVRMVKHKDGIRIMVDDVIRVRKDPNTLRKILRQTADIDRTLYPDIVTVVEHDPGQAGDWQVSDLRRNVFPDIPFKSPRPSGSKVVRAMPYANKAGDGYVLLLKGQWNADYIDEAEDFPDGAFADQIDSSSGAYKEVMGGLTGGLRVRSIGGLSSKRGKK
jgi:predicted phage terminase large subunit-like protein